MAYQKIVSTGSVYKGKTGMWLYVFHRVTGVGLFGYEHQRQPGKQSIM